MATQNYFPVQVQKIPKCYLKFTMKDGGKKTKTTKQTNQNQPNKQTENPTHQPKVELFQGNTREMGNPPLQPTFRLESETGSNSPGSTINLFFHSSLSAAPN